MLWKVQDSNLRCTTFISLILGHIQLATYPVAFVLSANLPIIILIIPLVV